jgi:hypothetical protein
MEEYKINWKEMLTRRALIGFQNRSSNFKRKEREVWKDL